jgi:hypothetical protein
MPTLEDLASRISQLETSAGIMTTLTTQVDDVARQLQRIQGGSGLLEPQSALSAWDETPPFVSSGSQPTVTYVGQAAQLLAGRNVSFTRLSNTPFLRIDIGDNMMNADYVVDSNGFGTHTTLYGTGGALEAAIATGLDRFIWVCSTHSETRTATHTLSPFASGQQIKVMSGSPYRPTLTFNFTGSAITQSSANAGSSWRLLFEGINFSASVGVTVDFYQPNSGINATRVEFASCNWEGSGTWQYLIKLNGTGSATSGGVTLTNCRGSMTAIAIISSGGAATAAFQIFNNTLALTSIISRSASTDYEAGNSYLFANNTITTSDIAFQLTYNMPVVFIGNNLVSSNAGVAYLFGTAGTSVVRDITFTGNHVQCSAINAATRAIRLGTSAAAPTMTNVNISGNDFLGPVTAGTAIEIVPSAGGTTCYIANAYRGWTTTVSGVLTGTAGGLDHGTLAGLTDDDHTQYILASGTRNLTGNWEASTTAEGYYIQAAKFIIDDSNFFLDIAAGASADYGYTTIGGTIDTVSAGEQNGSKFTITDSVTVTTMSAYVDLNTLTRTFRIALYTDVAGVPTTLLAYTADLTANTTAQWHTSAVAFDAAGAAITTVTLAAGTYWVSIHVNGGGGFDFLINYDAAAAGTSYVDNADTFSGGPETPWAGGSASARQYSAYVTGTVGTPTLSMDSTDTITYSRGSDTWSFNIAATAEMTIAAAGVKVTDRLTVANGGLTTDDLFYLDALSVTIPGLVFDTNDSLNYDRTADKFNLTIASVHVVNVTAALFNSGSTTNIFDGDGRIAGYWRVGSTSAPTNTTAGDLTIARLMVGNASFGSGIEAAITGDMTVSVALRVGSATAPTNATAGDITGVRLTIGSDAAFSATGGYFTKFLGTMTDTSSGAKVAFNYAPTISPATDSSADFRILNMSALISTSDVAVGTVATLVSEVDYRALNPGATGDVTAVLETARLTGVVLRTTNDARQDVTAMRVLAITGYSRPSGTGTVTIGTLTALAILGPTSAGATVTDYYALSVTNPGASFAPTNLYGINLEKLTRGATINAEFINAGKMVYTPTAHASITSANTTLAVTSRIVTLTGNANYTLIGAGGAGPTIADGLDGQVLTLINIDSADIFTFQDQGTLAASNLRLAAATVALGPLDSLELVFSATVGDWVQRGATNVL